MDYEKKYKEALEKAKRALCCDSKGYVKTDKELILSLFPELKESEDERIRTAIIHFISHTPTVPKGIIGKETMLAWLEKQANTSKKVTCTQEEVQPQKSKVGNYIVDDSGYLWNIDNDIHKSS